MIVSQAPVKTIEDYETTYTLHNTTQHNTAQHSITSWNALRIEHNNQS